MIWRKSTVFGMLGALAYLLHVVLGGILWKGYSHLMQPISDLTASGAPDRLLLQNILNFYALFSIIFAMSCYFYMKNFAPRISRIGMLMFFLMQLVSVLYKFFPEDLKGEPATFAGTMHIVITFLIIPLTIFSPFLIGLGLKKIESFRAFGIYSVITGVVIFIAGGTTVILFANKLPFFGLVERINIGSLQLWMFLTSLKFFQTDFVKPMQIKSKSVECEG